MTQPKISLIVTQRERFCLSKVSLDSILADDSYPFQLIYVDCGSPSDVYQYLQDQADKYDCIKLIRRDCYLRQNAAKNLALPMADTSDYIVFIDNDVIVEKGWLQPIVNCAEEEQASIVAPLILEGNPKLLDKQVHIFGVNFKFEEQESGKRRLKLQHLMHHVNLENQELHRTEVDAVEFHCTLVRRSLLEKIYLDEAFDNLESHLDLCMQTQDLGEKVFVEPSSRVTFLDPRMIGGFDWDDIQLYLFRWSDNLLLSTVSHAVEKWNIDPEDPYWLSLQTWTIFYRGQVSGSWSSLKFLS
jgi:GT2 family glycosyltransferase